jgi:hypothetical protein
MTNLIDGFLSITTRNQSDPRIELRPAEYNALMIATTARSLGGILSSSYLIIILLSPRQIGSAGPPLQAHEQG